MTSSTTCTLCLGGGRHLPTPTAPVHRSRGPQSSGTCSTLWPPAAQEASRVGLGASSHTSIGAETQPGPLNGFKDSGNLGVLLPRGRGLGARAAWNNVASQNTSMDPRCLQLTEFNHAGRDRHPAAQTHLGMRPERSQEDTDGPQRLAEGSVSRSTIQEARKQQLTAPQPAV